MYKIPQLIQKAKMCFETCVLNYGDFEALNCYYSREIGLPFAKAAS